MKSKKQGWIRGLASVLLAGCSALSLNANAQTPQSLLSYEMAITQAELQARVDAMSPIKMDKFRVVVALSAPKIELSEGSELFTVSSPVELSLPGQRATSANESINGFVKIKGVLRYDASAGAFYVDQAEVVDFEMKGLPEEHKVRAREFAQVAARRTFATRPVYVLRDDALKQRLARAVLKSVAVKNGKLVATLGF